MTTPIHDYSGNGRDLAPSSNPVAITGTVDAGHAAGLAGETLQGGAYNPTTAFTLVMLYRAAQANAVFVQERPGGGGEGFRLVRDGGNAKWLSTVTFNNGGNTALDTWGAGGGHATPTFPTDASWHLLAFRVNFPGFDISLRVDGTTGHAGTGAGGGSTFRFDLTPSNLQLGSATIDLDDTAWWNTALSDAQIDGLYSAFLAGTGYAAAVLALSPFAYWKFDAYEPVLGTLSAA